MVKSLPPIIFLHDSLETIKELDGLMALFREKGFETFAFNFSGHGLDATIPAEFRVDLFARDLDQFLKQNKFNHPVVFGHSLGGYVALYHKANFEDSPIKMIFTYGTKFNWSEQNIKKELTRLAPDYLMAKFPQEATMMKERHGENWKQLLLSTAHMFQNLEKLDGLTKEDIAEIDIPVFLILGDQDREISKEETALMSSWLKHSKTKVISHSKHELERSNLREIANTVIHQLD
jgi:pimeloyl-ACP methyl ester carboxylesterase